MTEKIIKFPINQYKHLLVDEIAYMEERAIRTAILTGFLACQSGNTKEEAVIMLIEADDEQDYKDTSEQTLRDYIAAGFSLHQERPELTGHEAFHLSRNHYEAIKHTTKGKI